jgi:hypothetical protein
MGGRGAVGFLLVVSPYQGPQKKPLGKPIGHHKPSHSGFFIANVSFDIAAHLGVSTPPASPPFNQSLYADFLLTHAITAMGCHCPDWGRDGGT